jgi:hypothetical protein
MENQFKKKKKNNIENHWIFKENFLKILSISILKALLEYIKL